MDPLESVTYESITYSVLNSPCFAWHPYEKHGLFKVECRYKVSVLYAHSGQACLYFISVVLL